eukprot:TRINITY_DN5029_c0_g2_i1.p1 TRINITY_DN5029_c0_g2~~TRINITY_DN5029_c0_g2_i1.p1  ORF type:complete len:402 (+),score=92.62 TRINITY_DN5029_c0_g2_i1:152-1207(+)
MGQQQSLATAEEDELLNAQIGSHFTFAEIKRLNKQFKAVSADDKGLTRTEFELALGKCFGGGSEAREFLNRLWDVFNTDHSDVVNFREFVSGLSVCTRGTMLERIRLGFVLFDINREGSVTKDEMVRVLSAMNTALTGASTLKRDVYVFPDVVAFVDDTFENLDVDHDGRLSATEFIQAVRQHPSLLEFATVMQQADEGETGPPNINTKKYLVCVDLGPFAYAAFEHVMHSTRKKDEIIVMHVHPTIDWNERPPLQSKDVYLAQWEQKGGKAKGELRALQELCKQTRPNVKCTTVFRTGEVNECIVEEVLAQGADVLVMGSHGKGTRRKLDVGQSVQYCMTHASCSVLVIK